MKAKEKADELIRKYYRDSDLLVEDLSWIQAKECALIAVDEIIKYQDSLIGMLDTNDGTNPMFWENVKQEIDEL